VDATYRTPRPGLRAVAGIPWVTARPLAPAAPSVSRGALFPAVLQLTHNNVAPWGFFQKLSLSKVFGKDERSNVYRENDLYQVLLDDPSLARRLPPIFLRAGKDDEYHLDMLSVYLSKYLSAMGATASLTIEQGTHDWESGRSAFRPS
jgi:hypothetical protein